MKRNGWIMVCLVCAVLLSWHICAATEKKDPFQDDNVDFLKEEKDSFAPDSIADPLEPWNRVVFRFNDKLYFWVLKPAAQGYKAVVPDPVRLGIRNFFHNLSAPIRIVNCFLQGKMEDTADEMARFVYNSTFGIAGFMDLAKDNPKLNPPEEDFGQTLAVMGIGNGCYIVWPVFGASTVRDTFGLGGDWLLTPTSYMDDTLVEVGVDALDIVNRTSFKLGDYEALKSAAIDPYVSLRNAYIQYRENRIADVEGSK